MAIVPRTPPRRRPAKPAREIVVADYPALKELCWNHHLPTIPGDEAFSRYEDGWKRLDVENLTQAERRLIDELTKVYGNGYFLG